MDPKEEITTKKLPSLTPVQKEIERILREESGATKFASGLRYLAAEVSGSKDYLAAVQKSRNKDIARRRAVARAAAEAAGLKVVD